MLNKLFAQFWLLIATIVGDIWVTAFGLDAVPAHDWKVVPILVTAIVVGLITAVLAIQKLSEWCTLRDKLINKMN